MEMSPSWCQPDTKQMSLGISRRSSGEKGVGEGKSQPYLQTAWERQQDGGWRDVQLGMTDTRWGKTEPEDMFGWGDVQQRWLTQVSTDVVTRGLLGQLAWEDIQIANKMVNTPGPQSEHHLKIRHHNDCVSHSNPVHLLLKYYTFRPGDLWKHTFLKQLWQQLWWSPYVWQHYLRWLSQGARFLQSSPGPSERRVLFSPRNWLMSHELLKIRRMSSPWQSFRTNRRA